MPARSWFSYRAAAPTCRPSSTPRPTRPTGCGSRRWAPTATTSRACPVHAPGAASPPSYAASPTSRAATEWDAALTAQVAAYRPSAGGPGGLHEAHRGGVPGARSAVARSTPTRRCCPSFPGMRGSGEEALDYGVKVTGCTLFVVDSGVDTGPVVAQSAVGVDDDDTVADPARADQDRRAPDARRLRGPDGPTMVSPSPSERSPSRERVEGSRQARRSPGAHLRLRQGGAGGPGAGAPRGRGRPGVHGLDRLADRRRRRAGDQGRGPHRVPRVPRRPGQDPASHDPRRDPGRHPQSRTTWLSWRDLGIEPFDLVVSNLYPFSDTVELRAPREEECVEQIDIGGPSMVRAAAKNHASVAIVTEPRRNTARCWWRFAVAASPSPSARPLRQRRSCTRPATTWRSPAGWATSWPTPVTAPASRRGPARRGPGRLSCATGRTRTRRRRCTADGPPRGRHRRAAPRQGDVLQQLHRRRCRPARGVRPRGAGCRRRQARQPLRCRGRCRHRTGIRPRSRVRPGVGVRWRHRDQPSRHGGETPKSINLIFSSFITILSTLISK